MKELLDFIGFMIVVCLIWLLIIGGKLHTLDETNVTSDYRTKDMVYVLPDSTKGMIESGYIFTRRHKDEVTKIKSDLTVYQLYTVIYTDKNGVIQRLKNVKTEFLVKRNGN